MPGHWVVGVVRGSPCRSTAEERRPTSATPARPRIARWLGFAVGGERHRDGIGQVGSRQFGWPAMAGQRLDITAAAKNRPNNSRKRAATTAAKTINFDIRGLVQAMPN